MRRLLATTFAALALAVMGPVRPVEAGSYWVYIGTYTDAQSKGIYRFSFDPATGAASTPELAIETPSPSFLAVHPSGKFLYAVNEVAEFNGQPTGSVSAYAVDPRTGALTFLNSAASGGSGPCHLNVDATGRAVLVANYGGGSVAALPIGPDGKLGAATAVCQHHGASVNKGRQSEPHAHSINLDAANQFAVAADLGTDELVVYRFDSVSRTLEPQMPATLAIAPGSGPRHFSFHPDGKHAYVINELANTVTALTYQPDSGRLEAQQTIGTLPEGFKGESYTAEIRVHPSGKFLYGSNRGHDSLALFTIEPGTGKLTASGHIPSGGKTPRNFAIDPTGQFLFAANQETGNVVLMAIDPGTGKRRDGVTETSIAVPKPVCVRFVPRAE